MNVLYKELFIDEVIKTYLPKLKDVPQRHVMKICDIDLDKLESLYDKLSAHRSDLPDHLNIYILSDQKEGRYATSTYITQLRNDSDKSLLILAPIGFNTAAEDGISDASVEILRTLTLRETILTSLEEALEQEKKKRWTEIKEALSAAKIPVVNLTESYSKYLMFVHKENYSDEAWGNGIYLLGLIPDNLLFLNTEKRPNTTQESLRINYEECVLTLVNTDTVPSDRINNLPLATITTNQGDESLQKTLLKFLQNEDFVSAQQMCHIIFRKYNNVLNLAEWNFIYSFDERIRNIGISISDFRFEGNPVGQDNPIISLNEKKARRISFTLKTEITDAQAGGIIDHAKIWVVDMTKNSSFQLGNNIPLPPTGRKSVTFKVKSTDIEEGNNYILRADLFTSATDNTSETKLNMENKFQPDSIEKDYSENHSNVKREEYREKNNFLFVNETQYFTIKHDTVDEENENEDEAPNRNETVTSHLQAEMLFRIKNIRLKKDKFDDLCDKPVSQPDWVETTVNNLYKISYGFSSNYQVCVNQYLRASESKLLNDCDDALAYLATEFNPEDDDVKGEEIEYVKIDYSPEDENESKAYDEFKKKRMSLFKDIRKNGGIVESYRLMHKNCAKNVSAYLSAYNNWICTLSDITPDLMRDVQLMDTFHMNVKLPNRDEWQQVLLLSPLHPLHLAWMLNFRNLYLEWEAETFKDTSHRKEWNKLKNYFSKDFCDTLKPMAIVLPKGDTATRIGALCEGWIAYMPKVDTSIEPRSVLTYIAETIGFQISNRRDTEVRDEDVKRYLKKYTETHPYAKRLVLNIFNPGDASVFAEGILKHEREINKNNKINKNKCALNDYEIRLFTKDSGLRPGRALRELLNPTAVKVTDEAEAFSEVSANTCFPKLRFSVNTIEQFTQKPDEYQAHLTFMINPFVTEASYIDADEVTDNSVHLNGVVFNTVKGYTSDNDSHYWKSYLSVDEGVETSDLKYFGQMVSRYQSIIGFAMGADKKCIPCLNLKQSPEDIELIQKIHSVSDWVITYDSNLGPEYYDRPAEPGSIPYLMDYVPADNLSNNSFMTVHSTIEVDNSLRPYLNYFNLDFNDEEIRIMANDLRCISSSIIMQANQTQDKAFEVLGLALTKKVLTKKNLLNKAFIIPIDLHKELFLNLDTDSSKRADLLLASIDEENNIIRFDIVEVKCRKQQEADIINHITLQQNNTRDALKEHFDHANKLLAQEIKDMQFQRILSFYLERAYRFNLMDNETYLRYAKYIKSLPKDFKMEFYFLGIIYDWSEQAVQRIIEKTDSTPKIYVFGPAAINDIVSDHTTMSTQRLLNYGNDIAEDFGLS